MNLRTIRQRIRSVQNTQKITRAMQMVAGAKLRRAHEELTAFRPYAQAMEEMTRRFLTAYPAFAHPLLEGSVIPAKAGIDPRLRGDDNASGRTAPAGLVVVTSDTGLCGTYNERVIGAAEKFLLEFPSAVLVTIGKKGARRFARRGAARAREVLDWGGRYDAERAGDLLEWLEEGFLQGRVSAWCVAYTQFLSALSWRPVVRTLLPVERAQPSVPGTGPLPERVIVEPDVPALADALLRESVKTQFARVLLEAFTAEHSARMIAMKNATENAEEMVGHLTLVRNKVRQAAITKELIEVVSGAQALQ